MADNNPLSMVGGAFAQPARERSTLEQIGRGLSAFGAGVQGRGAEFIAGERAEERRLTNERMQAAAQDMLRAKQLADAGNYEGIQNLALERAMLIEQIGGDPADTMQIGEMAGAAMMGDVNAINMLNSELTAGLLAAERAGFIEAGNGLQQQAIKLRERELEQRIAAQEAAEKRAEAERGLRRDELSLRQAAEKRMANKMSAASEKILNDSQDNFYRRSRTANEFQNLADQYENQDPASGFIANVSEFIKSALGTEDEVSRLRTNANRVIASEIVNNLPPGAASDSDVKMARDGFPTSTANPQMIASYFRGLSKIARMDAAFNEYRSRYVSENRNTRGFLREWNRNRENILAGMFEPEEPQQSTGNMRRYNPETGLIE